MDLTKLWTTVLSEIELSVSQAMFKTAFASSRLLSLERGVATIGVTNPVMRNMIENKYYSLVKSLLDAKTKENVSIVFAYVSKQKELTEEQVGPLFSHKQEASAGQLSVLARKFRLRPESTFDTFAVSPSNQLAHAAATAVSRSPGSAYNPLFLYGGVGVGKTHLMHAVAYDLLKKDPLLKVNYVMGEEFLNEIVEAIQNKTSIKFKQKYRSSRLLLVDDVQFIAGKQTAQEEFFHTFNAVHQAGGQIILTSDRPPSEISKLEDRLRSRFEGGLIVDLAPPDFELRMAIINIKAIALHLSVPSDAAQVIAAVVTDTRAIEGFLRSLINEVSTKNIDITKELVAKKLKVSLEEPNRDAAFSKKAYQRVTAQDVLESVADYFQIKPMHLKGPKRDRPLVRPRQLIMYICKNELRVTLDDIGGLLGGRDHTTVLHGIEKIEHELLTNKQIQDALLGIKQQLFTTE